MLLDAPDAPLSASSPEFAADETSAPSPDAAEELDDVMTLSNHREIAGDREIGEKVLVESFSSGPVAKV